MSRFNLGVLILAYASLSSLLYSDEGNLPKVAAHIVDFDKEVVPIVSVYCLRAMLVKMLVVVST